MGKKYRRKTNAKGRNVGEQYAKLSYDLMRALARNVSAPAIKLWMELRTRYYGGPDCDVHLSQDKAADLLGFSKSTAKRAYDELELFGFIAMVEEGSWYWSRATRWRFTDKPYKGLPTNDWKQRCSEKQNPGTDTERKGAENASPQYRGPEKRSA